MDIHQSPKPDTSQITERAGGDVNMTAIFVVGICAVLLMVNIVLGLQALVRYAARQQHQVKVVEPANREMQELKTRQMIDLETYRWVDRSEQVVAVPIDIAISAYADQADSRGD